MGKIKSLFTTAGRILPGSISKSLLKVYYNRRLDFFIRQEANIKYLKTFVKAGDTVVDIGSNIGLYTKALSQLVGKDGTVFSFEPVLRTYDILSFVIRKSKLQNVKKYCLALSDTQTKAFMNVPKDDKGFKNYYRAQIINSNPCISDSTINVNTSTLDIVLEKEGCIDKVTFVKCDVEGHELNVLEGAKKLIAEFDPVWLIETDGDPNSDLSNASKVFSFFKTLGYSPYCLSSEGVIKWHNGIISSDYIFLPPK